jgi:hypothetical protein
MSTDWQLKLLEKLNEDIVLAEIADYFRLLKAANTSREAIKSWLEGLRTQQHGTIVEDRILELLDLIEGYCKPEYSIWTSTG